MCEKRGRGYKRRGEMGPVNYVGDRNTREMRVLSLPRGFMGISLTGLIKKDERERGGKKGDWCLFPRMS